MLKFLTVALLMSLAIGAYGAASNREDPEDNAVAERPTMFEYLRGTFVGEVLDVACAVKELLSNKDVNDRLFKVRDDIPVIVDNYMTCAKPIVFAAMNNQNTAIGRVVNILRWGNTNKIEKPSDVYAYIPTYFFGIIPFVVFGGIGELGRSGRGISREMSQVSDQVSQSCNGVFEGMEPDLDYLSEQFRASFSKFGGRF